MQTICFTYSSTTEIFRFKLLDFQCKFDCRSSLPITILPDENDQKMVDLMVELWTNFATHHDPTPLDHKWSPVDSSNSYVILKDAQILHEKCPDREKRLAFWKSLEALVSN